MGLVSIKGRHELQSKPNNKLALASKEREETGVSGSSARKGPRTGEAHAQAWEEDRETAAVT